MKLGVAAVAALALALAVAVCPAAAPAQSEGAGASSKATEPATFGERLKENIKTDAHMIGGQIKETAIKIWNAGKAAIAAGKQKLNGGGPEKSAPSPGSGSE